MESQELITEISNRLVQAYKPLEIYLCGPSNWNSADDGDLELIVVVDSSNEPHRVKRSLVGNQALFGLMVGTFVFVYTKPEFDSFAQDYDTLAHLAKTRGQKIYANA